MIQLIYIDPGSGSYLAQVIIASILGVVFYFRNILQSIRSLLNRLFNRNNRNPE
jgi:hypothetical protein